ncbi:TlpA family protein disulfide reductase [Candidatus Poribacteria bacterium]|nr:TlpA family protein disulfide reductase [Candidatus Poribacteria bacterium]
MKTLIVITLIFAVGHFLTVLAIPDEIAAVPGKLPLFKARNLVDNKDLDLAKLNGHVLIVDFWATWCPPCVKEIPDFIELYKQYKDKQLTILGISVDANQKDVEKFIAEKNIPYPIIMVNEEIRAAFEKALGKPIRGVPTTLIFDREGKIVSVHEGYTKKEVFLEAIKPLLKTESPKAR